MESFVRVGHFFFRDREVVWRHSHVILAPFLVDDLNLVNRDGGDVWEQSRRPKMSFSSSFCWTSLVWALDGSQRQRVRGPNIKKEREVRMSVHVLQGSKLFIIFISCFVLWRRRNRVLVWDKLNLLLNSVFCRKSSGLLLGKKNPFFYLLNRSTVFILCVFLEG